MFNFKNAISPVVATALLLVVAVVSVVGFQGWFTDFSSEVLVGVESDSQSYNSLVGVEDLIGNILYINSGENLSIQSVSIGGIDCNIIGNYSGLAKLDVSYCISNLSGNSADIIVVTGEKVLESYQYIESSSSGLGVPVSNLLSLNYLNPSSFGLTTFDNGKSDLNIAYLYSYNGANFEGYHSFDGTTMVTLNTSLSTKGNSFYYIPYNNGVVYRGQDSGNNYGVYFSNLTHNILLQTLSSSSGFELFEFNNKIYISMNQNAGVGNELYVYDGSTLSIVEDYVSGATNFNPNEYFEFKNELFFVGNNPSYGYELYKLNGSSVALVGDMNSGVSHSFPKNFIISNDILYFTANGGSGDTFYSYDGNTVSLLTVLSSSGVSSPQLLEEGNGVIYFKANFGSKNIMSFNGSDVSLEINLTLHGINLNVREIFFNDGDLYVIAPKFGESTSVNYLFSYDLSLDSVSLLTTGFDIESLEKTNTNIIEYNNKFIFYGKNISSSKFQINSFDLVSKDMKILNMSYVPGSTSGYMDFFFIGNQLNYWFGDWN